MGRLDQQEIQKGNIFVRSEKKKVSKKNCKMEKGEPETGGGGISKRKGGGWTAE
jgi:hypothetical protein